VFAHLPKGMLKPPLFYLYILNMRISIFEKEAIVDTIIARDPEAKIWLFGSRTDNSKKGGDIDFYDVQE